MNDVKWITDKELLISKTARTTDVIEAIRRILPYSVKLHTKLNEDQRDSLNKHLGRESETHGRHDGAVYQFFDDPVWDRYADTLFFRSEADFMMALMFIGTENLEPNP